MANLPTYQCCTNHCLLELVKNYRSHPAILAYPSKHFYNGKLSAMAPPDEVNQLCGWKMLPNPKFPMLFCGVEGEDKQEGDSPSFFNPHEAIVVADLVMSLLKEKKLSEFDIGVISPFRKQITKIRSLLRSRRVWNVRVDSVNEMQGKERKAIIISTVRASRDWKEHDRVHGVGFLSDVRRLNTAITRARCLLAVVGDPYVLYQDAHWRDLIQYCQSNNSYIGPEIRLDNFEAREKKEQQHKQSQQQLKQQQQQQKQEEQQRQQQQLQLQKQEEDERLKQQQQFQLQLQQQQQQLQLAEQQKRQSQQPATKGSHPPPSPTQPPQNQHTQPPKPSAWQPLPAAVETERATLAPAPTTAQLLLGSAPPAMLPATQNPPPAQQLPPQGGFVVHAPAAHPWPWNGQPPQQHPLHPYHTTLGQHQSMPVVFNPHSLPYFTPSVLHPSPLPAMPHHLLAQPPIPAPAAFQPPPTVDTAAATTPGSAIAVVSAEERRANELLARQMMAPQPRPLPGLADESEAEEEQNEYAPLYSFEGQPLIMAKKTAPGYPAVMTNEKDGALVVKISLFGLSVTVQRNGQLIYVRLREAAEVKNALFTLPLLHPMPTSNGKRSKKAQSGERAVLLVAVPQGFDQSKTKFEEGQTLLIITMVRPALSTRLLTVTTTKTDLL